MRRWGLAIFVSAALAMPAAAADLAAKAPRIPAKAAPAAEPEPPPLPDHMPYRWTGFYVGGNIGGSWGSQDVTVGALPTVNLHPSGVIGGAQIGYNMQVDQIVFGVEADIQGAGQNDSGSVTGAPGFVPAATFNIQNDKLDMFGTVRVRAGFAFDRLLPYVTTGWAWGHGSVSGASTGGLVFSGSQSYSGWAIGGGVEWGITSQWSAKLEYLYIDFGSGPLIPGPIVAGRMTDNILRVGVNYKFF
jgi:outer membrane immunogenic protein